MRQAITTYLLALVLAGMVAAPVARAFFGFGKYDTVKAEQGMVRIPLAEVSDGQAHFFRYGRKGGDVKFFVLQSRDGVLRAAFDACDVCWREGKGYRQDGEFMVCVNCGRRFHSSRINVVEGGCNPAPLRRAIQGGDLYIRAEDIAAGARFFL